MSESPAPSPREHRLGDWLAANATAFAAVGCVAGALDALAGGAGGLSLLAWAALSGGLGTALGGAVAGAQVLVRRLPRWAYVPLYGVLTVRAAVWLAEDLGVMARLHTRYATLAQLTLAALTVAAIGGALILAALQPTQVSDETLGPSWAARSRRRRGALWVLCWLAALALTFALTRLSGGYPALRAVLGSTATLLAALPAQLSERALPKRIASTAPWVFAACAALVVATGAIGAEDRDVASRRPLLGAALHTVDRAADVDGDGYSSLMGGGDCQPLDEAVNPGAREVPGNGVDDNCRRGDAPSLAARAYEPAELEGAVRRSTVLVTIDTLRPDHLGAYGYARATSPSIDRFFGTEGCRIERAISPGGYTSIAVPSLHRGVYARRLHWQWAMQTNLLRLFPRHRVPPLVQGETLTFLYTMPADDPRPTLAQQLERMGVHTVAVVNDGPSQMLQAEWGAGLGFTDFVDVRTEHADPREDALTTDAALAVVAALPADAPYFLWVHYYGPHWPSTSRDDVRRFGTSEVDRYDHEVAVVDTEVGRLLEALAARSDFGRTQVFLTSDHGERFASSGRAHGHAIGLEDVRVPLLVRGANCANVDPYVRSTLDILPSILDGIGATLPTWLDGRPLSTPGDPARVVLADSWRTDADGEVDMDWVGAFDQQENLEYERVRNVSRGTPRTWEARAPLVDAIDEYLEYQSVLWFD